MDAPEFIEVENVHIAVRARAGAGPGLFWLGGYRSDMNGTKAKAIDGWAARTGHACTRHDYSGHGESGGAFANGTISRWLAESLAVFHAKTTGPQILVGSSMGGWIALRMVQELNRTHPASRVAGLILVAPAPDFTAELVEPALTAEKRRDLDEKGYFETDSQYSDEPYVYSRDLIEDGRRNLVLTAPIDTHCPVHILHGQQDPDVPYGLSLKLVEHLPADNVTLTLIRDGDHRLSRAQDIDLLLRVVGRMVRQVG